MGAQQLLSCEVGERAAKNKSENNAAYDTQNKAATNERLAYKGSTCFDDPLGIGLQRGRHYGSVSGWWWRR
jgi:hypothetical protein